MALENTIVSLRGLLQLPSRSLSSSAFCRSVRTEVVVVRLMRLYCGGSLGMDFGLSYVSGVIFHVTNYNMHTGYTYYNTIMCNATRHAFLVAKNGRVHYTIYIIIYILLTHER